MLSPFQSEDLLLRWTRPGGKKVRVQIVHAHPQLKLSVKLNSLAGVKLKQFTILSNKLHIGIHWCLGKNKFNY